MTGISSHFFYLFNPFYQKSLVCKLHLINVLRQRVSPGSEITRQVEQRFWKLPLCDVTKGSKATLRLAQYNSIIFVASPNVDGPNGVMISKKLKLNVLSFFWQEAVNSGNKNAVFWRSTDFYWIIDRSRGLQFSD